jgi:transcriptional regulator with XRE-family HTH domain
MKQQRVNTTWFKDRLAERDLSMRRLAKLLELDPSAVSLMLRGKRVMTADEANRISGLLTIPVTEVLAQAGIQIDDDARHLPIKAYVDARGVLTPLTSKNPRRIAAPRDVPANGLAIQIRAPELQMDGWVIFAGAFDLRVTALIDRLCVIEIQSDGHMVGTLKRGYDDERFNLVPFTGAAVSANVAVKAAAPVLWIRPV